MSDGEFVSLEGYIVPTPIELEPYVKTKYGSFKLVPMIEDLQTQIKDLQIKVEFLETKL